MSSFRASPAAYGSSQARPPLLWPRPQPQHWWIRATSVTYTTMHGNTRSWTHWVRPGIEPPSSWILVGFITAEPWWELLNFFFFFFFFFCFFGPHPWYMEVPRLGGESELQLPAYTTATAIQDPSHVWDLYHSSRQCQILNPLHWTWGSNLHHGRQYWILNLLCYSGNSLFLEFFYYYLFSFFWLPNGTWSSGPGIRSEPKLQPMQHWIL